VLKLSRSQSRSLLPLGIEKRRAEDIIDISTSNFNSNEEDNIGLQSGGTAVEGARTPGGMAVEVREERQLKLDETNNQILLMTAKILGS
jgi:hypothetical protein